MIKQETKFDENGKCIYASLKVRKRNLDYNYLFDVINSRYELKLGASSYPRNLGCLSLIILMPFAFIITLSLILAIARFLPTYLFFPVFMISEFAVMFYVYKYQQIIATSIKINHFALFNNSFIIDSKFYSMKSYQTLFNFDSKNIYKRVIDFKTQAIDTIESKNRLEFGEEYLLYHTGKIVDIFLDHYRLELNANEIKEIKIMDARFKDWDNIIKNLEKLDEPSFFANKYIFSLKYKKGN